MYLYVLISTEYRLQCTYFEQRLDKNAQNTIKISQNFPEFYVSMIFTCGGAVWSISHFDSEPIWGHGASVNRRGEQIAD